MPARKRVKPRYRIDMKVQAWDLAKAGSAMTIEVHDRTGLRGTIQIGQGSFRWKPAHGKLGFKPIRWGTLCEALDGFYR